MKLPTSGMPKTEQRLSANNISLIAHAKLIFLCCYEETHHFVMYLVKIERTPVSKKVPSKNQRTYSSDINF